MYELEHERAGVAVSCLETNSLLFCNSLGFAGIFSGEVIDLRESMLRRTLPSQEDSQKVLREIHRKNPDSKFEFGRGCSRFFPFSPPTRPSQEITSRALSHFNSSRQSLRVPFVFSLPSSHQPPPLPFLYLSLSLLFRQIWVAAHPKMYNGKKIIKSLSKPEQKKSRLKQRGEFQSFITSLS